MGLISSLFFLLVWDQSHLSFFGPIGIDPKCIKKVVLGSIPNVPKKHKWDQSQVYQKRMNGIDPKNHKWDRSQMYQKRTNGIDPK